MTLVSGFFFHTLTPLISYAHYSFESWLFPTQAAEVCGTLEIDSALDTVDSLNSDLKAYEKSAAEGKLIPLPGETVSYK